MQVHFASLCAPILDTVRSTAVACRELGVLPVFTQHGHADPEADAGMLHAWWGELIREGSADHALLDGIGNRPDDLVVRKRRYDAFHGTGLEAHFRRRGIDEIAVAGVMTNLCVESTVRAAFVRDFRVHVLMDATATASAEMQLASLRNMAFGFAHVRTARDWLDALPPRK